MNRVVATMLVVIGVITAVMMGSSLYQKNQAEAKVDTTEQKQVEISQADEEILDDCTDEVNQPLEVNSNYEKEDTTYILKEQDGVIAVYKEKEEGNELYDLTDISVDYLTDDDKQNLKNGIEVTGLDSLNQLLEDFE